MNDSFPLEVFKVHSDDLAVVLVGNHCTGFPTGKSSNFFNFFLLFRALIISIFFSNCAFAQLALWSYNGIKTFLTAKKCSEDNISGLPSKLPKLLDFRLFDTFGTQTPKQVQP
jgi:hypothetical protein